jgi:hypothetical protein
VGVGVVHFGENGGVRGERSEHVVRWDVRSSCLVGDGSVVFDLWW